MTRLFVVSSSHENSHSTSHFHDIASVTRITVIHLTPLVLLSSCPSQYCLPLDLDTLSLPRDTYTGCVLDVSRTTTGGGVDMVEERDDRRRLW